MPRVTLFDPRHSFVTWHEAKELSDAVGLPPKDLAITRPERLAFHSVLIRVTSQLYVPDGPNYADLGISLRHMSAELYQGFILPNMAEVRAAFDAVEIVARQEIEALLDQHIYNPADLTVQEPAGLLRWFKSATPKPAKTDPTERALALSMTWKDQRNADIPSASRRAVARTLAAILNMRGRLVLEADVVAKVAVGLVLNRLGSAAVGEAVEPLFNAGVAALGYRVLPPQAEPVVLNAKGASASGKSTIRAAQRAIAERQGYEWQDFAIISPDYWRKALIDYEGLGTDYKYAAMLCGQELEVIDRKLDILMAVKGREGTVPHMLIDRFRFDSFQRDRVRAEDSTLLTRFGTRIFLFFLITPPAATVERAWSRALETGRYKAVDDLLYHNIEAYSGMPDLFLRWATQQGKWVHYEFLDNSVDKGAPPRCIAYGDNGRLVVKDLDRFCDIERFRAINVDATRPDDVFTHVLPETDAMAVLRRAMAELKEVVVLVPGSDAVFARSVEGRVTLDASRLPDGVTPDAFGSHILSDKALGTEPPANDATIIGA